MKHFFYDLEEPSLFVASPGDMLRFRNMASSIVEDMGRQGARSLGISVYKYEEAEREDTDSIEIQKLIARPDDKLSEGIVAFFGEKIGQNLASDFPCDMLQSLPDLSTGIREGDKRYRLVHPWQEDAEEDGGFPLTGSTFEVLCALAGQQRLEAAGSEKRLPSFICFASPKEVLDYEDPEDAPWGNDRLWEETNRKHKGQKRKLRAEQDKLSQQRIRLANFAKYLSLQGREPRFIEKGDEIEEAYRSWLRNNGLTGSQDPTGVNPFMGLRSYDVKDHAAYFGREDEAEEAVKLVEAAYADPIAPQFYWIKGSSGVGKSSFLRAGLIGDLISSYRVTGRYAHVVFRPNQLLSGAEVASVNDPLKVVFDKAFAELQREFQNQTPDPAQLNHHSKTYAELQPEARGAWVFRTLEAWVEASEADAQNDHRLIIGIDQFEEIVDMLHDTEQAGQWASFVDFITECLNAKRLFIAATLRQRRLEKMREHPKLGPLWDRTSVHEYELRVPNMADLRRIMTRPFETINHNYLADDLLTHLLQQVSSIQSKDEGRLAGRVMPLVSLVLEQIHRNVGEPAWKKKFETAQASEDEDQTDASNQMNAAFQGFDTSPEKISLEMASGHADLDGVIAVLAEMAMKEARTKTEIRAQDSTLDDLLRKLVRWAGDSEDDDTQFSLPAIPMPTTGAEEKIARALRKYRLLMDDGEGKVRLVHETVLKKWPEAAEFMERERPLYRIGQEMRTDARRWEKGRAIDEFQIEEFGEAACEMLGLWLHRFNSFFVNDIDPAECRLRDYCLALMARLNTPRAVVEKTLFKSNHLYLAAIYGRSDILRDMLTSDPEAVNVRRADGRTAIVGPCFDADMDVLETLLEFKADPNLAQDKDYTPLQVAAIGGGVEFTKRLLDAGAEITDEPLHPIHWAASNGHADLVSYYLTEHQTAPEVRDRFGWAPAHYAVSSNQCDTLRALAPVADLNVTLDPKAEKPLGCSVLHLAAMNGALDAIKLLLELGVPCDQKAETGATALHYAVKYDQPVTVGYLARFMIENGPGNANPRMVHVWTGEDLHKHKEAMAKDKPPENERKLQGWTPLHIAVQEGNARCVNALLAAQTDPNIRNGGKQTPLHLAISEGQEDCAILLAKAADLTIRDGDNNTPLQAALLRDDLTLAIEIAANDPARKFDFVNEHRITDLQKLTLLHKACASNNENVLRFLLNSELPADLNDVYGRNPLHVAAANGNANLLTLLVSKAGFDMHARDNDGRTALELACLAGRFRSVSVLADAWYGPDLCSACPAALHLATTSGQLRIVQRLAELGFPTSAKDSLGRTPLTIAAALNHADITEWLLSLDETDALQTVEDRPTLTAHRMAVTAGSEEALSLLVGHTGTDDLPLKELIWEAVEYGNYGCAAILLEHADTHDIRHPKSGLGLGDFFSEQLKSHPAKDDLSENAGAGKLDRLLRSAAEKRNDSDETESTGASSERPGKKVRSAKKPAGMTAPTPTGGTTPKEGLTQSLQNGLASDIYAALDTENTFWTPVEGEERDKFIEQINPVDGKHTINPDTAEIHWRSLPWYDKVSMIQVTDPGFETPDLAICYLTDQGNLFRLNGTSPPIHEVNAKAPIKLNESNVADYLRFFCFFVRGEEGPFYVLEDAADPLLPAAEPTVRSIIEGTARPVTFEGVNDKGHFVVDAVISYSNAIFIANFAVQPTGMIEMLDDEPIAADMPIRVRAPLA